MTGFDTARFLTGLPLVAAAITVVVLATFAVALRVGRHSVIDVAWGFAFAVVAAVSFVWSSGHGSASIRVTILAMTALWGLRLAGYIGLRQIGADEDPRYDRMLSKAPGSRTAFAARKIYLTQGAAVLLVSLPIQVASYESGSINVLAVVGIVIWGVGLFFESVGDAQLAVFKRNSANKGKVMDQGLWRYTRHPNYFGDACVWWGIFVVSAAHWPGVLTVLSPIAMTYFLTRGTGKATLEGHMGSRPGFQDYVTRTSGFFPLPPKTSS